MKVINNIRYPVVELPEDVWNYIRKVLGRQPFDEVSQILQHLGQQIQAQLNPVEQEYHGRTNGQNELLRQSLKGASDVNPVK